MGGTTHNIIKSKIVDSKGDQLVYFHSTQAYYKIIIEVGMLTLELYSYLLEILNDAVLIYNTQSNSDWLFYTQ